MNASGASRSVGDPADRFLAAIVLHAAIRRGVTRQELIDLGVRYKRLDFVKEMITRG